MYVRLTSHDDIDAIQSLFRSASQALNDLIVSKEGESNIYVHDYWQMMLEKVKTHVDWRNRL